MNYAYINTLSIHQFSLNIGEILLLHHIHEIEQLFIKFIGRPSGL